MPDELSYYGYEQPHTTDWDYKSWMGIGDRNNDLIPGYSAALSVSDRKRLLGVDSGTSTGQEFTFQGKTYRDDDTSPQHFNNVDVYSPGGVPGSPTYNPAVAVPLGKSSGQSLGPSQTSLSSQPGGLSGSQETPIRDTQAFQDLATPVSDSTQATSSTQQATGQGTGDSLLKGFKAAFPQHANTDLSTIMQKVAAIHPNIEPARLEELWTRAGTFQDLANEEKKAQEAYGKSFATLKKFYEGSGDSGDGGSDTG